jgi:hypothetical protein
MIKYPLTVSKIQLRYYICLLKDLVRVNHVVSLPIMFPSAQTACSHTFWCGDDNSLKNKGTAPVIKRHL